jgi:hypothetical protein
MRNKLLFDEYAMAAMQGAIVAFSKDHELDLLMTQEIYRERIANLSFAMAELMIERRNAMQEASVL